MIKVRASRLGEVMTKPRSKAATLSKTAETYAKDLVLSEKFSYRKPDFYSKYTDKGNEVETESKNIAARVLGYNLLLKNEKHFENEYLTGTPDVILPDEIIDIKSSWDMFTFPFFEDELPTKNYYWQGVAYCILTGRRKFSIIYVLTDTPEHLIEREAWNYVNRNALDMTDEVMAEFKSKMTYGNIPEKYRVKRYTFDVADEVITQVHEQLKIFIDYCKYLSKKLTE
jgi:hypothetical protein